MSAESKPAEVLDPVPDVHFAPTFHAQLLKSFGRHFPIGSVVASAVVYASGFLVLEVFHDGYRLRGVDADLFRMRFFHVGIMFVGSLLTIGLPFGAILYRRRVKRLKLPFVLSAYAIPVFGLIELSFYCVLFLSPPGTFRQPVVMGCLLIEIVSVLGLAAKVRSDRKRQVAWKHERASFIAIVGLMSCCFIAIVGTFATNIKDAVWPQATWFALFAALLTLMLAMIYAIGDESGRPIGQQRLRVVLGIVVVGFLYYVEINAFAAGLFHFIPAARGGGDFSDGRVVLRLYNDAVYSMPPDLIACKTANIATTRKLVLIEATSSSLYLADPCKGVGGPRGWRSGIANRPQNVYEVHRGDGVTVEFCRE